ncbi:MAG: DUF4214 domain-containing protein [Pseudomonadota bacterium]
MTDSTSQNSSDAPLGTYANVFDVVDGRVVMEAEDGYFAFQGKTVWDSKNAGWQETTEFSGAGLVDYQIEDYSGDGIVWWQGGDRINPGGGDNYTDQAWVHNIAPISYTFYVGDEDRTGTYYVGIRALQPEFVIGNNGHSNNDFYFAYEPGPAMLNNKTALSGNNGGVEWEKVYFNGRGHEDGFNGGGSNGAVGNEWHWTVFEEDATYFQKITVDAPGYHTIYIGARSDYVGIDQIQLLHNSSIDHDAGKQWATTHFDANYASTRQNEAPVAHDDSAATSTSQSVLVDVLANDFDAYSPQDALSILSVSDGIHGSAEIVDGKVLYTPNANFPNAWHGAQFQDSFTYAITDDDNGTATATVDVLLTAEADPSLPTPTIGAFVEENGLVVIEMESASTLTGAWKDASNYSTSVSPNLNNPGAASGGNFIIWEGKQYFGKPGNGVIEYNVQITNPGTYQFQWRSQVSKDFSSSEHNDTWLKIEADQFYGADRKVLSQATSIVHPKGASADTYPDGAHPAEGGGADGWFKIYSFAPTNEWTWASYTNDNKWHWIYADFDAPGTYTILVSGRSSSHAVDRMVLSKVDGDVSFTEAQDLSLPESNRVGDAQTPVDQVINGDSGHNNLGGGGGNDLISADAGEDVVNGGQGDDLIYGGQGKDDIFGGSGNDTLSGGADADYLAGGQGGDRLFGGAGSDILYGENGAVDRDQYAEQVFRLYQATLDRAPDGLGHTYWTNVLENGSMHLGQAVIGFMDAPEFQTKYGATDNPGFVTLLYSNVLERAPDAGGLTYWTGLLNSGTSRSDVVLNFVESPEFKANTETPALAFSTDAVQGGFSDDVFRLYHATLDRDPDTAGVDYWTGALANGMSKQQAASGFVSSAEFQSKYGATDNAQFVSLLYNNVLGREPDAGGLTYWVGELDAGMSRSDAVLGFADSAEFITLTTAELKTFMRSDALLPFSDELDGGAGSNVLIGGIGADYFKFDSNTSFDTTVVDFEAWDFIVIENSGYGSIGEAAARFSQVGGNAVFSDAGKTITFLDASVSDLIADDTLILS